MATKQFTVGRRALRLAEKARSGQRTRGVKKDARAGVRASALAASWDNVFAEAEAKARGNGAADAVRRAREMFNEVLEKQIRAARTRVVVQLGMETEGALSEGLRDLRAALLDGDGDGMPRQLDAFWRAG